MFAQFFSIIEMLWKDFWISSEVLEKQLSCVSIENLQITTLLLFFHCSKSANSILTSQIFVLD